jgi:predicted amidohydrolase
VTLKTACIQLNAGPDIAGNLREASALVREAAGQGARFIATPENTCHMRNTAAEKLKTSLPEKDHPVLTEFAALAKELNVWLLAGSVSVKISPDKIANRSVLFGDKGEIAARYDKIRRFDVDLPTGESHRESNLVQPGDKAVVAQAPFGAVGLTVCYDLRFAYLYRRLAQAGASIIAVPSAFTVPTGRAHWETLLRARAIETGAFILAPAQCGEHEGGRRTWGHSMIVGPWGDILAEAQDKPGVIYADLDLSAVEKTRSAIPALKHDRKI